MTFSLSASMSPYRGVFANGKAKNGELQTNALNAAKGNAKFINLYKYSKILYGIPKIHAVLHQGSHSIYGKKEKFLKRC